jgi:hypothetical protein
MPGSNFTETSLPAFHGHRQRTERPSSSCPCFRFQAAPWEIWAKIVVTGPRIDRGDRTLIRMASASEYPSLEDQLMASYRGRIPYRLGLAVLLSAAVIASEAARADAFCLAPVAIADRWNDTIAIPGYAGETRKTPDWRNDGIWEREAFSDVNGDGFYDAGETYVDANANGSYDAEPYGALVTGYVLSATPENVISPGGDLGLQITLVPAASTSDESPGHYLSLQSDCTSFLSAERPNGSDVRAIDSFFRNQIGADSGATWDPVTKQVVGSEFCISPRLIPLPVYDPRRPLRDPHGVVQATKIIEVFVEAVVGKGSAIIRIASFPSLAPALCTTTLSNSSGPRVAFPAKTTWGQLKASYR